MLVRDDLWSSGRCIGAVLRGANGLDKVLPGPAVYDGIEEALERHGDRLH